MADRSPPFLLLFFWTLSTGVFAAEENRVFSSSGETVHLPCRNTVQYCRTSETVWMYIRDRQAAAVELITYGVKRRNSERLNLGSDCSLTISRVTAEDAGVYTCQQWRGDQKQGNDSPVYLHVVAVSVSPSSSSSDIRPGVSLTLSCQLFSYAGVHCSDLFGYKDVRLSWENQAGVNLSTNSRYQIMSYPEVCILSLSTTLIREDEDKQWRCGVYQRYELKASDTFTVQYSARGSTATAEPKPRTEKPAETTKAKTTSAVTTAKAKTTSAVTPVHNTTTTVLSVLLSAAALAVFIAAVLCWIRRRRAAAHQKGTGESAVKGENQVNYETIHISINPAARAHEQTDDSVTYSEVTCAGNKPEKSASDHSKDSVTYAAVSRTA